jgi:AcrR family transcriptional regulator
METGKKTSVSRRRMLMQEDLSALVRTQAMQLFRQQGLHFTMQQVAEPLHISKKTIYTVYPSKEALLLDMVDHAFADIHRCKQEILAGSGTLQEKLRAVIIAMPAEYAALDLKELDEKYPVVAARVRSQLENGWEPTMALLEQAVAEGVMRPVSLPVLRQMITASIESFLADRSLAESGVQYVAVLEEMISILLEGVLPR